VSKSRAAELHRTTRKTGPRTGCRKESALAVEQAHQDRRVAIARDLGGRNRLFDRPARTEQFARTVTVKRQQAPGVMQVARGAPPSEPVELQPQRTIDETQPTIVQHRAHSS